MRNLSTPETSTSTLHFAISIVDEVQDRLTSTKTHASGEGPFAENGSGVLVASHSTARLRRMDTIYLRQLRYSSRNDFYFLKKAAANRLAMIN